jgi:hypothetical protein
MLFEIIRVFSASSVPQRLNSIYCESLKLTNSLTRRHSELLRLHLIPHFDLGIPHYEAPRSIISSACLSVASVMVLPPSIRAISSIRSFFSSSRTSVLVRSFFTDFATP